MRAIPHVLSDGGWGLGLAIVLLQLVTLALPPSEGRDWAYYYLTGGSAFLFIAGTAALHWWRGFSDEAGRPAKLALTTYAALALSWYFLPPLLSPWLIWVWVLAVLAGVRMQDPGLRKRLLTPEPWAAAWFFLIAFSMCGSLLRHSPWLALATDPDAKRYAVALLVFVLIIGPFVYRALTRDAQERGEGLRRGARAAAHMAAVYALALLAFRLGGLETRFAVHHWRAYLEPAASLRDGGWLLWDVPNVYGFLQTLLLAFLPTDSTWQSLYLINAAAITLTAYMIFRALAAHYRSAGGHLFALALAASCVLMILPTTGDPRLFPSTGALRFFWVYPMAAYVFRLKDAHAMQGRLPENGLLAGNAIWLLGVLWSLESALFVTVIWLPPLLLFTLAEGISGVAYPTGKEMVRAVLRALAGAASLPAAMLLIITLYYLARLGHAPDFSLLAAYPKAFAFSYATLPITGFAALPCWLFVFFMMAACAALYGMRARIDTRSLMHMAALYAAIAALWAVASYYIPFSEDLHLTGTLPVMVFVSALALRLLGELDLPELAVSVYEKAMVCFYSVIAAGTLAHMTPGAFDGIRFPLIVHGDMSEVLTPPEPKLQAVLDHAQIPQGAYVQVISQPMEAEGENHVLKHVEGVFIHGANWKSWVLPNTILGYDAPLPGALYEQLAMRRAERMDNAEGWVIEKKDNPLENYPWIKNAITPSFQEKVVYENKEYRVRKYERIAP